MGIPLRDSILGRDVLDVRRLHYSRSATNPTFAAPRRVAHFPFWADLSGDVGLGMKAGGLVERMGRTLYGGLYRASDGHEMLVNPKSGRGDVNAPEHPSVCGDR